jgi:hypothetical protein
MLFDDSNEGIFLFCCTLHLHGVVCNITTQGKGKDQPALIVFTVGLHVECKAFVAVYPLSFVLGLYLCIIHDFALQIYYTRLGLTGTVHYIIYLLSSPKLMSRIGVV